jgi:hypothetical protein
MTTVDGAASDDTANLESDARSTSAIPGQRNAEDGDSPSAIAHFVGHNVEPEAGVNTDDPAEIAPTDRRQRSKWKTVAAVIGVLVLVCTGSTLALVVGLTNRYENKVERTDILGDVPKPAQVEGARQPR